MASLAWRQPTISISRGDKPPGHGFMLGVRQRLRKRAVVLRIVPLTRRWPLLRSALDGVDENDLGTRMQRSADRLRSGSFSDPFETSLTSDLQKLGQQVGEAARALGKAQHASKDTALNSAMDDLSRLRDQLDGLGRPNGQSNAQTGQGQAGRAGQRRRPRRRQAYCRTAAARRGRNDRPKALAPSTAITAR